MVEVSLDHRLARQAQQQGTLVFSRHTCRVRLSHLWRGEVVDGKHRRSVELMVTKTSIFGLALHELLPYASKEKRLGPNTVTL